jgi:hypothetical protein
MSPSWNNHPRSRDSRSRPEETDASCARLGGRKEKKNRKENQRPCATKKRFHSVPANSMLLAVLVLTGTYYADAIRSPARSPVPRAIGKTVVCGHLLSLISTLADSAACGYICLRSGLPASHRLSQSSGDSQQPLGNVHTLPCFLLCLGPLFCFPLATWLRAR